jgi:hypothetical protein
VIMPAAEQAGMVPEGGAGPQRDEFEVHNLRT